MDTSPGHRTGFHESLKQLNNTVLRLGSFCVEMLSQAMKALGEQDLELARNVHRSDDIADDLNQEIEKTAVMLLVSQQPVAGDLRMLTSALHMASDLERVADYAKDIAKVTLAVGPQPWFKPLVDTGRMGQYVIEMLSLSVRALADADLKLAQQVAHSDHEVDALWRRLWDELLEHMKTNPACIPQANYLILVARYLERIGDHVVNVMERLYYTETGKLEIPQPAEGEE